MKLSVSKCVLSLFFLGGRVFDESSAPICRGYTVNT